MACQRGFYNALPDRFTDKMQGNIFVIAGLVPAIRAYKTSLA
jgi:hypothetical protein